MYAAIAVEVPQPVATQVVLLPVPTAVVALAEEEALPVVVALVVVAAPVAVEVEERDLANTLEYSYG